MAIVLHKGHPCRKNQTFIILLVKLDTKNQMIRLYPMRKGSFMRILTMMRTPNLSYEEGKIEVPSSDYFGCI